VATTETLEDDIRAIKTGAFQLLCAPTAQG